MNVDPALMVLLGLGGLILYGIWSSTRTHWPIKLVVTGDGLVSHRGIPQRCVSKLADFFARNVELDSKLVVLASRSRNGRLNTKIRGRVDAGTKQRIRNFMLLEL